MRPNAGLLLAFVLNSVGCGLQVATTVPPTESPSPSLNVASLRAAGLKHLDAGRLDAAIQTLESAYRVAPRDTEASRLLCEAYNQRAVARYSNDNLEEAIADLRRSLELDPRQSEIRMQLTRAQTRLHRLNAIGKQDGPAD